MEWQDRQPDKVVVSTFFNEEDVPGDVYAEEADPNEVALHITSHYEPEKITSFYTNPIKAVQIAQQLMEAARKALVVPEDQ